MEAYALVRTEFGAFGFVARDNRIVATYLPGPKPGIVRRIAQDHPEAERRPRLLPRFQRKIERYFNGETVRFDESLELSDQPPFRRKVLEQCRRIPYGTTASYGDLARAAGSPGAARAVGSAMAHNSLPLLIPCHRVLCANGSIGGFSSPDGVRQKEQMLRLEGTIGASLSA